MICRAVGSTLFALLVVGGCSAPPSGAGDAGGGTDPLGAVPDDFSVDLTVRAAAEPQQETGGPRVSSSRSHYVVFCDGSLHWVAGRADPTWGLPPQRRVLDRGQLAELWSLLQHLGYADPDNGAAPVNARLLEAAPGEAISLCILTGHGRRWAFVSREAPDQEPDPAMSRLIEHLDELAWATATTTPATEGPRRTEYGPDPYAKYRQP